MVNSGNGLEGGAAKPVWTPPAGVINGEARSNLSFALSVLPKEKRNDMLTFYAFCRVVDDLADDAGLTLDERQSGLAHWRRFLEGAVAEAPPEDSLEAEVQTLRSDYSLGPEYFLELISGMEMDLTVRRYETWEELRKYCYRVASAVGLISIEIFGHRNPETRVYAEELGYAFQLTNILRDVGQDWRKDQRIYLPLEDLEKFGYSEEDLRQGVTDARFRELMAFESRRAWGYYERAQSALPEEDRGTMLAAELMREIYSRILRKMDQDGYRVFETRYRLPKAQMVGLLGKALASRVRAK